jgi:hypothetical protein
MAQRSMQHALQRAVKRVLLSKAVTMHSFSWKDYRKNGKKGVMTLDANEFLRRFCLLILPPGFARLRHYGILASRNKATALAQARSSLGIPSPRSRCQRPIGKNSSSKPQASTSTLVPVAKQAA